MQPLAQSRRGKSHSLQQPWDEPYLPVANLSFTNNKIEITVTFTHSIQCYKKFLPHQCGNLNYIVEISLFHLTKCLKKHLNQFQFIVDD